MHRVVPELILENYRAGRFGGAFPSAGMFLDLSGFSRMTDALMQHGQHGAEVLAGLMYGVFDPLVRSIFEHGGRIVSFAGDGIMALFPVDGDQHATALRALGSAWAIQRQLAENPDRSTPYGRFYFSVKIGLTIGSVSWRILRSAGGDHATYYFRGTAVDGAADAEHHAAAGEIVLTDRIQATLGESIETHPYGSFHRFLRFVDELPGTTPCSLPPVDVESSRIFMPEDVIVHDIRGEFRQIVNLFMRIPDLTDERLEDFINAVFELRKQYGGLLTRIDFGDKGCNMLMLWGAPMAYENDIVRALNFFLDLQERMDFPITAGVTYYIAHAGYLGSEMCEDYTCYGWGVNLASRFMMNAPTGQIWVDERVARRVSQSFDIEYIGSQHFKGFAAEQKVNLLRGRKQDLDAIYQGEMVGRQEELARLAGFVASAWQGRFAGVVGVAGDAGVGKGRLIHAFHTSPVFEDRQILWANCPADQILRQAFNPVKRWLHRYFGFAPHHASADRKSVFDTKLDELIASLPDPELVRELQRTRSILGALVGLEWDDSLYSHLDAEGRYNNTFLALIALVKAESLRQPLVIFVDDVHFIDSDTLAFLSQLKRSLSASPETCPAAIILAYRKQGFDLKLGDDLLDLEIELGGIHTADVAHLSEIVLGGPASHELVDLIVSRSEGNPYFAEQIIRYLQEEDLLEMSPDGWRQVKRGQGSALPQDINALLVARLDQLAQQVKAVVQTASVLGREFEVRVLAQMLGPAADTEERVRDAERAVIWLPLREMRYIFYHALLRDAAYSMQMRARRQELHRLALGALEKTYGADPESHYAELAYHAENGDLREKAQRYYSLAGRVSADLYQNSQAAEYLTRALAYAPFDDYPARFELVAKRVELFSYMGKRDLQLKDLDALEKWAERLNDSERLARTMMLRSAYHYFMGNYRESIQYAKQAEDTSDALWSTDQAMYTQVVWCTSLLRLGRLEESMQRALAALDRCRAFGNRREESRILNVMGLVALEQKDPAPALGYFSTSLRIARELRLTEIESKSLSNLAMAEVSINGNYALAHEYYLESSKIAHEVGDRFGESASLGNLGFSAGLLGDFTAARAYHAQSLQIAREVGNRFQQIYTLINLSSLAGLQKDSSTALQYALDAAELARDTSEPSGEAWAMLYMGHAWSQQGEYEPAREAYQKSIDIRRRLDQSSLSMEPLSGLVEIAMAANDLESAAGNAETVLRFLQTNPTLEGTDEPLRVHYTCFRYLEMKRDPRSRQVLQQAKQLLVSQVSKFKSETERKRYIENIPWRRALWDAEA